MSTTTDKSKSISFNAEMLRLTIDGNKTQTRRVIFSQPLIKVGDWRQINDTPNWIEVTKLRVEKLQDISESDAIAEGLSSMSKDGQTYKYGIPDIDGWPGTDDHGWGWQDWCVSPVEAFKKLWQSIYAKNEAKCWDANPYVLVIEYKLLITTGEPS